MPALELVKYQFTSLGWNWLKHFYNKNVINILFIYNIGVIFATINNPYEIFGTSKKAGT